MRHFFKLTFLALAVFLVGSSLVLGGVAYAYRARFYPGVKISGIDLSGKSYQQGEQLVTSKVTQYLQHPVKVVVPDVTHPTGPNQYADLAIATTASQLGLIFADQDAINQSWQIGHARSLSSWLTQVLPVLFNGSHRTLAYKIDQTKVQTFIDTQVVPKIGMPEPARLQVVEGNVSVLPPRPGFSVDRQQLSKLLAESLETATDNDTSYLRAPVSQINSEITQEKVQPVADKLNALGAVKVKLSNSDLVLTPTREQLLSWFAPVQDSQGTVGLVIQKEVVAQYLAGQSVLDQGASLDATMKTLTELLATNTKDIAPTAQVALISKPKPTPTEVADSGYSLGKFSGKYVEVNLAAQRLYLIDGSSLIKSYVVSTGKWSTPTPTGTFSIHDKSPRAYSAEFGLYMPYWQDFLNGEYGLHELPEWPNGYKEGESHLGIPVSHGCVRLGVGAAKEVYDWTEVGTPVYIF